MNEKHLYCRSTNNIPRFIDFINELGGEGQLVLRKVYGRRVETHEKLDFIPWSSIIELYEGTSEDLEEPTTSLFFLYRQKYGTLSETGFELSEIT